MAFFDKLGETISSKSKDVAKKAKDFAEISNLNSQIYGQQEIINKAYMEIGKTYFENNQEGPDNIYNAQFDTIQAAKKVINELKEDIKNIKGVAICPKCGAEVAAGTAFCGSCGTKMPAETEGQPE